MLSGEVGDSILVVGVFEAAVVVVGLSESDMPTYRDLQGPRLRWPCCAAHAPGRKAYQHVSETGGFPGHDPWLRRTVQEIPGCIRDRWHSTLLRLCKPAG